MCYFQSRGILVFRFCHFLAYMHFIRVIASCSENGLGSSAVGPGGLICPFISRWEPLILGRDTLYFPNCEMTSSFLILAPGAPKRFFRGFIICEAFYALYSLDLSQLRECCIAYFVFGFSLSFYFCPSLKCSQTSDLDSLRPWSSTITEFCTLPKCCLHASNSVLLLDPVFSLPTLLFCFASQLLGVWTCSSLCPGAEFLTHSPLYHQE